MLQLIRTKVKEVVQLVTAIQLLPGIQTQEAELYPKGCIGETSSSIPDTLHLRHNSLVSGFE